MTCPRCQGLMAYDYWSTDDGMSGLDWRCILCSWRVPVTWRQEYDPLRKMPPKGVPEEKEFVLRRNGEFFHRKTRV